MDNSNMSSSTASFYEDSNLEAAYVYIRTLGKGAFGEAVLYRKDADDSLVVWKEIDLQRLSDKERRESQNEIEILSILNHANIVSYYNHFMDGETLLIEMEYANGGNLAEKIAMQSTLFPEETVLWYFYQVAAAVAHIHEYGILHRDIKGLNIFLTKSGLIKLGDFGISKIMESKTQMAESYKGTPYYMSPELIQGHPYNQKSDIWSTGCVLYELLTGSKVFDATNALKLAWDIVQKSFEDIDPSYSTEIRTLLHDMLNKDPTQRPSSEDILKYPIMVRVAPEMTKKVWELNSATRKARMTVNMSAEMHPVVTSRSSELYFWGGGKLTPQKFDVFTKGRSALQVSTGQAHFAVVSVEKELYTWTTAQGGQEMVGQLGHGDTAAYKAPKKVAAFDGIAIKQAACGEDFTVVLTDEGAVYSFGSDYYGCLGCDNVEGDSVCTPVLLEFFKDKPVEQISCGDAHVIALTKEGEVFTWGCGEFGRLGLGSEDDFASPQKVHIRGGKHGIKSVHAGTDGSFVVKTNGRVLACGSNEDNKLGFNSSAHGLRKHAKQISYDIPCKYTFSTVKPLSKYNITMISAGSSHSAAVDLYGHLLVFGSNKYGQLGVGDFKERHGINLITGSLSGKRVVKVACGDGFTVISTSENQIYSWGLSENGRLGTVSRGDSGRGPNGQCFALPRTIFGSLHVVSDVSCCYWNTILVAEKVLAQKTIRSTSVLQMKSGAPPHDSLPGDDDFHEECSPTSSRPRSAEAAARQLPGGGGLSGQSTAPAWLKLELQEAEFIPVDSPVILSADTSMEESSVPEWLQQDLLGAETGEGEGGSSQSSPSVDQPDMPSQPSQPSQPPSQPSASTPQSPGQPPAPNYLDTDLTTQEASDLQLIIDQLREENSKIKLDHDALKKDHESLQKAHESHQKDHDSLQKDHDSLQKDHKSLQKDQDDLKHQSVVLRKDCDSLQEENADLKKENCSLKAQVQALEDSKAIVEEQNAKLSYEVFESRRHDKE